jgi:hypothetical protein
VSLFEMTTDRTIVPADREDLGPTGSLGVADMA